MSRYVAVMGMFMADADERADDEEGGGWDDPGELRPLVAFDFDGTLTARDSFMNYLSWKSGRTRYALGLSRLSLPSAAYLRHRDRGRLKAALVKEFLAGVPRDELEESARAFAEARAQKLFRPDALATWRRWRQRGATLVIVTASPEIIVAPFARGIGADLLLGTQLLFDDEGRVTGELNGPNCRGAEKVARLRAQFGADVRLSAAYGDTAGDKEMLAIAGEKGFRVFTGRP